MSSVASSVKRLAVFVVCCTTYARWTTVRAEKTDMTDDRMTAVLQKAIETCRPSGGEWTIATSTDWPTLMAKVARGVEPARWFTFQTDDDDDVHSGLYRTACQFLRCYWPDSIKPA
jgi:hypothetical protein